MVPHRLRFPATVAQFLFATVFVLATSAPALAVNRAAAERAARKACLTGDHAKGVEILSDLFIDSKNPTYIFNQGRCLEQNKQYDDAIEKFKEYLRVGEGSLSFGDKNAAQKHIDDCKATLEQYRAAAPAVIAPQAFVPPTATVPDRVPETAAPVVAQSDAEAAPAQGGRGLRIAGVVTASVGLAGLITGAVLNFKVANMVHDMENNVGGYTRSANNDRKKYQTMAWIAYGAGGACVVTGAILYGIGLASKRGPSNATALVPVVAPGQVGIALAGRFL